MFSLLTPAGEITATSLDLTLAAAAVLESMNGPLYYTPAPILLLEKAPEGCAVPFCEHTPAQKADLGGECFCAEDCECPTHVALRDEQEFGFVVSV